jgi:anti-anti-sigma factor
MSDGRATVTGVTVDRNIIRGATIAAITGRVGIEEANELQRRFDEVFKTGRPWVVLTMKDVDFICSAGMGTLLSAVGEARKGGGEVIFTDISPKVRTIFEFLDIWDYITTAADREAALEMVAAGKRMQARQTATTLTPSFIADDVRSKLEQGIRLSKEGKLKDALAYLNAALKAERDNVTALTWKANVLERLGQFGEARRLYRRACEIGRGDRKLLAYARDRVEKLNQKLRLTADRDRAFEQLEVATRELAAVPARRPGFLAPGRTVAEESAPFLECCRTWDEGTVYDGDNAARVYVRGGGYYVWIGGRGVALDPGRNFVARLAAVGRRLVDVDAVVVTDVRWNHGADLEPLLEAVRRYNKGGADAVKKLEVLVNAGVYKKSYSWLSGAKDVVSKLTVLYPDHAYRVGTAALDVKPTDLPEGRTDNALGLMFTAGPATLAYVADAPGRDLDVMAARYRGARGRVLVSCLRAAGPKDAAGAEPREECLSVEEVARLIAEVRPAVCLVGEIYGINDPVAMSAAVAKAAGVRCLPLDVGLTVNLETLEIALAEGWTPAAEIGVRLGQDGRLLYARRNPT